MTTTLITIDDNQQLRAHYSQMTKDDDTEET